MSRENPLWGAPRIHGELLMLGIEVSESTVGRYMIRTGYSRSQGWKPFLRNHAAGIASIDLFVVHTISFKLLYALVILRHARRQLVTVGVTTNPTAEWIANQVTDAFPRDEAPRHLIRDRDGSFGTAYTDAFGPWAFAIIRLRRVRRGRTVMSNGSSDQYGANLSITSLCSGRRTCVAPKLATSKQAQNETFRAPPLGLFGLGREIAIGSFTGNSDIVIMQSAEDRPVHRRSPGVVSEAV
jgi:hypothetical protein